MILGMELLRRTAGRIRAAYLGADNQAALRSTEVKRARPCQYLVRQLELAIQRNLTKRPLMD